MEDKLLMLYRLAERQVNLKRQQELKSFVGYLSILTYIDSFKENSLPLNFHNSFYGNFISKLGEAER